MTVFTTNCRRRGVEFTLDQRAIVRGVGPLCPDCLDDAGESGGPLVRNVIGR